MPHGVNCFIDEWVTTRTFCTHNSNLGTFMYARCGERLSSSMAVHIYGRVEHLKRYMETIDFTEAARLVLSTVNFPFSVFSRILRQHVRITRRTIDMSSCVSLLPNIMQSSGYL